MANPPEHKPVLHTKKHIARLERERFQTRLILYSFIAVLVIVVGLVLYGYLDVKYFQARRPIAKVGNAGIPLGPWQARVRLERSRLINQINVYQQYAQYLGMDLSSQIQQFTTQLDDPTTLGQNVLNEMIDEEIIRQESAKRGITVSPQQVQDAIQAAYNYFPNGSPTPTATGVPINTPTLGPETLALITLTPTLGPPTPTTTAGPDVTPSPGEPPLATGSPAPTAEATEGPTITPTAAATETPAVTATPAPTETPFPTATLVSKEGFDELYKSGTDRLVALGMTEDEIRELYATNLLRDKLMEVVEANEPRTEEKVWARHILVADEATAQAVRQRLLNGEDFAKVAAEVSTDTGTKDSGGDLGWFGKGAMVAEFETAAFALKVGEISQPVKSQFGYHIIQVLAHSSIPLDDNAYRQAQQTAFSKWLEDQRDVYKVVIYNNWQDKVPTDPAAPLAPQ